MKPWLWCILPLAFVLVAGCTTASSGGASPTYAASPLASLPPKPKLGNEGWRPSKPMPHVVLSDEEKEHYRRIHLESLIDEEYPVDVDKLPPVVAYLSFHEVGTVMAACLKQAGWEAKPSQAGTVYEASVPPDQRPKFNEAKLACEAMYPIDPRYVKGWQEGPNRALAETLYEYNRDFLAKCVARYGYKLKLPSKEVYIANLLGHGPHDTGYPDDDERVAVACPYEPPAEAVFGGP